MLTSPTLIAGFPLHGSRIRYGCLECCAVYGLHDGEEYHFGMNRAKQKASPYCRRCAEVGKDAICHQFAAVALKAGVDLERVSNSALLLEIKPQDRHGKHWFFISEHAKTRNGTVVREFTTIEDYPQGQMYDGDNYCRGPCRFRLMLPG